MLRRTRVTRRSFMSATALGVGALARYIPLREEWARAPQSAGPWKVDMTLYDRPGWCSHAWYHMRGEDGSILVPIQSSDMGKPYGDFIRTETDDLVLKSADDGKTWTLFRDPGLTAYPWGCYGLPGRTHEGMLVSVVCAAYVLSAEERQEHLNRYGIARFYNAKSEWLYTPWPIALAPELRRKGIYVFIAPREGGKELAFSLNSFVCRTSRDGGKTWINRSIRGLPFNSDEAGSFRNTVVTRKGMWVASVFGTPNPERKPVIDAEFGSSRMPIGSFALRSQDQGNSWQLVQIAYDSTGEHSFDETALLELPSGRILAMIRHTHWQKEKREDVYLYESHSDDQGRTWSTPISTGMWGYPAHLLILRSGKILCTYGHRDDPWGHRASLSSDGGKTWDVGNIKLVRDDSLPGWTTYPMSSQLDDGTIFTTYGILKKAAPGAIPAAKDGHEEDRYVYAAASFYSEAFVRPLGFGTAAERGSAS